MAFFFLGPAGAPVAPPRMAFICPRRRWEAWVEQARVLLGLAPGEPIPANTPAFFRLNRGALNGGEAKAMAPRRVTLSDACRSAASVLARGSYGPAAGAVQTRWCGQSPSS